MPIDEVVFGKMCGTLEAVAESVNRMEAAILPALQLQQKDMADHKRDDIILSGRVDRIQEWKDGTNGDPGAKQQITQLVNGKAKIVGFMAAITVLGGAAGHKLSQGADVLLAMFAGR